MLRYVDNPNGSIDDIAGICNEGRNVVGLMPHPERACHALLGSTDGRAAAAVAAAWPLGAARVTLRPADVPALSRRGDAGLLERRGGDADLAPDARSVMPLRSP